MPKGSPATLALVLLGVLSTLRFCTRPLFLLAALTAVFGTPAAGQNFSKLSFMAGCWRGQLSEETEVEEIWSQPSENLMLGLTFHLDRSGKRAKSWEFTFIERTDSTIYFVAQTRAEKPDTFRVKSLVDEVARWDREGQDYPASIMYRRTSDGAIIVRLEAPPGSEQGSVELRMTRMKCPGA